MAAAIVPACSVTVRAGVQRWEENQSQLARSFGTVPRSWMLTCDA